MCSSDLAPRSLRRTARAASPRTCRRCTRYSPPHRPYTMHKQCRRKTLRDQERPTRGAARSLCVQICKNKTPGTCGKHAISCKKTIKTRDFRTKIARIFNQKTGAFSRQQPQAEPGRPLCHPLRTACIGHATRTQNSPTSAPGGDSRAERQTFRIRG